MYSAHAHECACVCVSVCVEGGGRACMKVEVLAQCMSVYVEGGGCKSTYWCTGMCEKGGCGEGANLTSPKISDTHTITLPVQLTIFHTVTLKNCLGDSSPILLHENKTKYLESLKHLYSSNFPPKKHLTLV